MDKLNVFGGGLSYRKENRLTWALMNLIRISPIIRAAFLDLIRDKQKRPIPSLTTLRERECVVQTQVKNIDAEEGRLVAIGITAEGNDVDVDVQPDDRKAIYDGVVTFVAPEGRQHQQESLILTIESKLDSEVGSWQLKPSAKSLGAQIKVDPQAVILAWRDIVSTLTDIELRGLVNPAEKVLIRDFIYYVAAAYHSKLKPFEHFAVCRDDLYLLNRRCEVILREICPTVACQKAYYIAVKFPSYKRIYLKANAEYDHAGSWRITLELYPGDTMTQAQKFWSKVDAKKLLALRNKDWRLVPNLLFRHWSNRCEATTSLVVNDYVRLWSSGEMEIVSLWPDDSGSYCHNWDCLVAKSLISPDDVESIEAVRTEKNDPWISMSPGLGISYTWSAKQAAQLDRDGTFVREVKDRICEATETWSEVPEFCR